VTLSTSRNTSRNRSGSDKYDIYSELYDPDWTINERRPRKERKKPKPSPTEILSTLTDETVGLEAGFETTYQPARYEAVWLLNSLRPFYELDLITDVLAVVKGGKEASVYRCKANPATGHEFLAAKVYRPRMFRNLRNDKVYREGRAVLTESGRAVKNNEHRIMRAINKKSAFGMQVAHTSWLMYEHTTLENLYNAGVAVPKPLAAAENALLMGYIGDEHRAAPTLHETRLSEAEASRVYREVMTNIHQMLALDLIHGDLSAYNILYWEGKITIIDFPQVVNSQTNDNAKSLLARDIQRVCEYFELYGIETDAAALAADLWQRYTRFSDQDRLMRFSRWLEEQISKEEN
jgi:RIO kinase 1